LRGVRDELVELAEVFRRSRDVQTRAVKTLGEFYYTIKQQLFE
jgi:hypothetical protein